MLAIHHNENGFSKQWIEYCRQNNVDFKIVDCYSTDIIDQLRNCDGLMWHWAHWDYKAILFSRQLTISLEKSGKRVFPNSNTSWHFDDKVGQKYLLEAIGAPLVQSFVFYEKVRALLWAETTNFPKVFKLRGGAGSENVWLVRNFKEAKALINQAFSSGFTAKNRIYFLKERYWQFMRDKNVLSFLNLSKGFARLLIPTITERQQPIERNYAYFQDFIPGCDHDIRVVVIGNRAFAIKRLVRDGDFRASGSGKIDYNPESIPKACLELSFALSKKLDSQCLAYDFVFAANQPLLVEISYGFSSNGYYQCRGYWDSNLNWFAGKFVPENLMIEDFLGDLNAKR